MKNTISLLSFLAVFIFTLPAYGVHSLTNEYTHESFISSQEMTVDEFLKIDFSEFRKADGKKLKWTHRLGLKMTQKNLARKVEKGKIESAAPMAAAVESGSNNTFGLLSIIFAGAGLFIPYLGIPMLVAALVLGIIGIKKDRNPTMAIIGTVVSSVFLLLIVINGYYYG